MPKKSTRYTKFREIESTHVKISRKNFRGNILDFSVKDDSFKLFNVFTWPESATNKLEGEILIAGSYGGVTTDLTTKEVRAFYCKDVVGSDFVCEPEIDDEKVYKNPAIKGTVLAVEVEGTMIPENEAFKNMFVVVGLDSETVVLRFS